MQKSTSNTKRQVQLNICNINLSEIIKDAEAYIISNHLELLLKFSGKLKVLSDNFILGNRFLKISNQLHSHTCNSNLGCQALCYCCHRIYQTVSNKTETNDINHKNITMK